MGDDSEFDKTEAIMAVTDQRYSKDFLYSAGFVDGAKWQHDKIKNQLEEECRINGMGQERELKLMTDNAQLKKKLDAALSLTQQAGTFTDPAQVLQAIHDWIRE